MNFIKLTLESGKKTYVNFEKVSDFAEKNEGTEIFFAEEQYYFKVKETPEQILQLIENSSVLLVEEEVLKVGQRVFTESEVKDLRDKIIHSITTYKGIEESFNEFLRNEKTK